MTPPDALVFELRQRLTAAMLQAGLLARMDSYAELSVRLDALEHEFSLIAVLMQALVARDGRTDERSEPDGRTAFMRVEQMLGLATHSPADLIGLAGTADALMERAH